MTHYARLTCVLALCVSALAAQSVPAVPALQTTGMIGLAETQTARLNLLNPGVLAPAAGAICTAQVAFVDGTGAVLKSATLAVLPGKSMYLDLHDVVIALAVGERRQIRAVLTFPLVPPPTAGAVAAAPCKVIPTLEIFDKVTGRTTVALGHVESIP